VDLLVAESRADEQLRQAAFAHVQQLLATRDQLTSEDLRAGFQFEGERVPLVNPQRGIFKPQRLQYLLSIRTVYPKAGARVWYDDQREVHAQIYRGDDMVEYAFMGQDPDSADNRWLREAYLNHIPIIYFLGVSPGRYTAVIPAFIEYWDAKTLKAKVTFGIADQGELVVPDSVVERRYALRQVQQRLHQASFRDAVIAAYDGRCALSNLPERTLLDAAHIVADRHESLGQPIVPNGLPLSKIHHAAFDAHLIGIDPDRRIHIAERLLAQKDGPILESMKGLRGASLRLPKRSRDAPDRERLAQRFALFCSANV
jgi:putative restriction endonuclease